jgi:hypothetical protein
MGRGQGSGEGRKGSEEHCRSLSHSSLSLPPQEGRRGVNYPCWLNLTKRSFPSTMNSKLMTWMQQMDLENQVVNIWKVYPFFSITAHHPERNILCCGLWCFLDSFMSFFFLKTNGMTISEKRLSPGTSDSVRINIYSWALRPIDSHFLQSLELGPCQWKLIYTRISFPFIRNMCVLLSSGNLDRSQIQSNIQKSAGCGSNTQIKCPISQHFMILEPSLLSGQTLSRASQGRMLNFCDRATLV